VDIEVRQAEEADLSAVLAVLDEAASWLQAIGVTEQWPESFSGDPASVGALRDAVGRGEVFAALASGAVVGTCLLEHHPFARRVERVWPDAALDAVLLSKLAVRRLRGTGRRQRDLRLVGRFHA
jgi:hypothetical protein